MDVGMIGLGAMGSRMAANLADAGHRVIAWNRSPVEPPSGVTLVEDAAAVGRAAEQAFVMVAGPEDVREVVLGPSGWAQGAAEGSVLIQASTIGPTATRELDQSLREQGLKTIDAPVGGSTGPAATGALVILAGGDPTDLDRVAPLFDVIGAKTLRLGQVGSGSAVKLLINAVLVAAIAAEAEVLAWLAEAEPDLDLEQVAGALERISPVAAKRLPDVVGDPVPAGFSIRHAEKDMRLALVEAGSGTVLAAVAEALAAAGSNGYADNDMAALGASAREQRR